VKKFFGITIPVLAATLVAAVALVEAWVRVTWDPARGRPGLFVSDPVRLDKLAPNYDGWFAGVPVRTNALGFRDNRNYQLEKRPGTFRILVLGDSVTFGHGSVYEHTYPLLLEQRLKAWKPSVDWQVWNLGVPGYNTSQELAYLLEVGSAYRPDLVVVGFFGNDFSDNHDVVSPTRRAVVASAVTTWFKRHMYSFDLYRKVGVTLRYRLRASQVERSVLENMAEQDRMLAKPSEVAQLHAQQLTDPAPLSEEERAKTPCPRTHGGMADHAASAADPSADSRKRVLEEGSRSPAAVQSRRLVPYGVLRQRGAADMLERRHVRRAIHVRRRRVRGAAAVGRRARRQLVPRDWTLPSVADAGGSRPLARKFECGQGDRVV
jgi:hypothetical protein